MKRIRLTITAITAITLFAIPAMARDHGRGGGRHGYPTVSRHHRVHHRDLSYGHHGHREVRRHVGYGYAAPVRYGHYDYGHRRQVVRYGCPPYGYGRGYGHGSISLYGPRIGVGIGW